MTTRNYIGESVIRREDVRFLTGTGRYTEDITLPGLLHASIVRSTAAHGRLRSIDTGAARSAPGVVAVLTADDLGDDLPQIPTDWILPVMSGIPTRWALARDRVRFVGEAIAIVVAETRPLADDAAQLVVVDYDELPAVVDAEAAALPGAPQLHDDFPGNESFLWHIGSGDFDVAVAEADVVVELRLVNQRVQASPLEGRAVVADFDAGTGRLTLYTGTQNVHLVRRNLSLATGIPEHRLKVVTPAVGGGFGAKLCMYPEDALLAVVSRRLGRPVRWAETRSEHFVATSHGRDHVEHVKVAATNEGKILGLKVETYANVGAYISGMGAGIPAVSGLMFQGCYDIAHVDVDIYGIFTNTTTTETYRGAGRPEAAYLIERAVDALAVRLGVDPVEIRRRNFIQPEQFPYTNACGMTYDTGDYERGLDEALKLIGYDDFRRQQREARQAGRLIGIGLGSYVEFCGFGDSVMLDLVGFQRATYEQAVVAVSRTGKVAVQVGIDSAGQGHETSIAQVVADRLSLPIEDVDVLQGDTDVVHYGTGTFNSRSMSSAGSAAWLAAGKVLDKARRVAAHLLEAHVDDIVYEDGVFGVAGVPNPPGGRTLTFADVSHVAVLGHNLPPDEEPTLKEMAVFDPPKFTYPFGTHAVVVEVERDTGEVRILRYVAVDDSGKLVNPLLATGQILGGVAQGIGQALFEQITYDEDGQPTSASYMQYCVPKAHQMPHVETAHTVTPSPINPLGAKGVGESGVIGPPPAIVNAVLDALRPLGVTHLDMPLAPPRVWAAIQEAQQ